MPVKNTTALPKRHYKTEFQEKIVAFAPKDPEPFVLDTTEKLKLIGVIAAISTLTTLVLGGTYHLVKKFLD